jgi:sec-independent protein translocase protein TatA
MGKFGITELLIVLAIVVLLFGTKKLKGMGGDVGSAIKSFRKAIKNEDDDAPEETATKATKIDEKEQSKQ